MYSLYMQTPTYTWMITTQAEGRRKSRPMTHTIEAATSDDAIFEARQAHIWQGRVAFDRSIFVTNIYAAVPAA